MLRKYGYIPHFHHSVFCESRHHRNHLPHSRNGPLAIKGKLSLPLSADGANILQSNFTYQKHLCALVMLAVYIMLPSTAA